MNESKTFIYVSVSTVQVKQGRAQKANSIRQLLAHTHTLCSQIRVPAKVEELA